MGSDPDGTPGVTKRHKTYTHTHSDRLVYFVWGLHSSSLTESIQKRFLEPWSAWIAMHQQFLGRPLDDSKAAGATNESTEHRCWGDSGDSAGCPVQCWLMAAKRSNMHSCRLELWIRQHLRSDQQIPANPATWMNWLSSCSSELHVFECEPSPTERLHRAYWAYRLPLKNRRPSVAMGCEATPLLERYGNRCTSYCDLNKSTCDPSWNSWASEIPRQDTNSLTAFLLHSLVFHCSHPPPLRTIKWNELSSCMFLSLPSWTILAVLYTSRSKVCIILTWQWFVQ